MLIGKYYHTLEEKGRVSLPSEFRGKTTNWIVTRGLDGGLFLLPKNTFQQELARLESRSFTKKSHRDFIRLMTNEAKELLVDKQGRVQLPEYLIEFAKFSKNLVIVGSMTRLEIWDRDIYHQYIDRVEPQAEVIAESLAHNEEQDD